jgi:hypothetical protein
MSGYALGTKDFMGQLLLPGTSKDLSRTRWLTGAYLFMLPGIKF